MSKLKIGDLFELATPKGKAYLQFVYKEKTISELIRVLPGIFSSRPEDLDDLVKSKEMFLIFFPLNSAYKKKIVEFVENFPLPSGFEKPKFMRSKHIVKDEFLGWHIIDTDTWHRRLVKEISIEQKMLSPWGIWNDTLLIDRLIQGWSLENWV